MSALDNIYSDSMSDATDKAELPPANGKMTLQVFGRTDVGQVREHNEDNFVVANLDTQERGLKDDNRSPVVSGKGMLFGVCDGMGGAAAGEVASQLAVDIIYEQLASEEALATRDTLARRLVRAIEHAGARIFQEARADRSRRGMGTTATVAAFRDERIFIGQVGDSRAYLLREGKLVQLTRDQSLVNQLIEAGQLTEEEAETFEHNNIILQALGTAETVQVDLTYVDVHKGDVLMLCSDGLSGMIRAEEIHEVLSREAEPMEACRELTERANAAGGHDNITVIIARFDEGLDPPGPEDPFGYQKYSLPDIESDAQTPDNDVDSGPSSADSMSDEAQRESRNLRVSHTVVGMQSPLARRAGSGSESVDENEKTPESGTTRPKRNRGDASDPPVELPTNNFPPALMGTIVLSAMLLAALLGYLALR